MTSSTRDGAATTASLGWHPVRDVPPPLAAAVADAESAAVRWFRTRDGAELDTWVASWAAVCTNPQLAQASLAFRLDALNRHGIALQSRGGQLRRDSDLQSAAACWEAALALAPADWPDRSRYLHNLAVLALTRYQRSGDMAHLGAAIPLLERAIASAAPAEVNLGLYHSMLGIALSYRYERMGGLDDLERAIAHGQLALAVTPPDAPSRGAHQLHLGSRYRLRFARTHDRRDLDRAIELLTAAVALAEGGSSPAAQLEVRLTNLGNALLDRYDPATNPADLDAALAVQRRAVAASRADDPQLPARLNNLGNCLRRHVSLSQDPARLEEAIAVYTRAVEATQPGDPQLSSRLYNLANCLADRHRRSGGAEDRDEAARRYREACTAGLEQSLEWTLSASVAWGRLAEERADWQEAGEAYGFGLLAIERLYHAQALDRHKRAWLVQAHDLARLAAYAYARMGRLEDAVVTLEQNRTRALAEALDYQGASLAGVTAADREALARVRARIGDLEARLATTDASEAPGFLAASGELAAARAEAAALVERIRAYVPGFAPEGLAYADLAALVAKAERPIIYLLTTTHGSVALIVRPARADGGAIRAAIHPCWLDGFTLADLERIFYGQEGAPGYLRGSVLGDVEVLRPLLDEIWTRLADRLMRPLVAWLVAQGAQRAFLVPTGTLSLLPLHAIVIESVAFALTPSGRALRSVLRDTDHADVPLRLLAVGNPTSAGLPALSFARAEIEHIAAMFVSRAFATDTCYERAATLQTLTAHLAGATHIHFACHGRFFPADALDSAIYLADRDTLTLGALMSGALDVHAARLVVLSACQTAITDFANVPDEAIGFQSGFIRAGVPGVISTLWPVDDLSTSALMSRFYHHHLLEDLEPAVALQRAQCWLRAATAAELDLAAHYRRVYIASGRTDGRAFRAMRHHAAHPETKPYAHPYFWAGFMFSGV